MFVLSVLLTPSLPWGLLDTTRVNVAVNKNSDVKNVCKNREEEAEGGRKINNIHLLLLSLLSEPVLDISSSPWPMR